MASTDRLDDIKWLVSLEAEPWLAVADQTRDEPLQTIRRLRKALTPGRTQWVVELVRERQRARAKFAMAEQMFFTGLGLEQATDQWIAAYKARRFAAGAPVADLCCGIGGDLLALAERGPTSGVDHHPTAAMFAAANLRVCRGGAIDPAGSESHGATEGYSAADLGGSSVECASIERFDLDRCSAWHIDPDRRPTGRRTTKVDLHEPSTVAIDRVLARNPNGAVKLAPAAELPERWAEQAELEWISRRRECRQLVAWFGQLAQIPGQRRASVLSPTGDCLRTVRGDPATQIQIAPAIGGYIYEPDPAVLAAGLSGALASQLELAAVSPGVAYFTSDHVRADLALAGFRVLDLLRFRPKTISEWLSDNRIGHLEIKKRGVHFDPAQLRGQLRLGDGDRSAVLLIAPVDQRPVVIAAERLTAEAT